VRALCGVRGHLMRANATTAYLRKDDSSLDATLNSVALPSGEIVSWAAAFPRPGQGAAYRTLLLRPVTAKPTR
jgi:hypothetical protein